MLIGYNQGMEPILNTVHLAGTAYSNSAALGFTANGIAMTGSLEKTALHDWHASHGGKMVDFADWSMPVHYGSITEEHLAARQHVALFDVSHMGRLLFFGKDAARFLDRLTTRKVIDLKPGRIRYSLITRDDGGVLDDILVYHLQQPDGTPFFGMVVNASNRQQIVHWIQEHEAAALDVNWVDETLNSAMIAVQGPQALELAKQICGFDPATLSYFSGRSIVIDEHMWVVSRTGYTGEDGVELVVPAEVAESVWCQFMSAGEAVSVRAAGLGARDTLRLEAAMPLYGHELSCEINAMQTGLPFALSLEDRIFPGRDAIAKAGDDASLPRRIGLQLDGRRVPRQNYNVVTTAGETIGEVTSGTFSPTLACPIAMAYVQPSYAEVGTELAIDIRGQQAPAKIVKLPFYQRP